MKIYLGIVMYRVLNFLKGLKITYTNKKITHFINIHKMQHVRYKIQR